MPSPDPHRPLYPCHRLPLPPPPLSHTSHPACDTAVGQRFDFYRRRRASGRRRRWICVSQRWIFLRHRWIWATQSLDVEFRPSDGSGRRRWHGRAAAGVPVPPDGRGKEKQQRGQPYRRRRHGYRPRSRPEEQEDQAHRAQVRRCLPQAPRQGITGLNKLKEYLHFDLLYFLPQA